MAVDLKPDFEIPESKSAKFQPVLVSRSVRVRATPIFSHSQPCLLSTPHNVGFSTVGYHRFF